MKVPGFSAAELRERLYNELTDAPLIVVNKTEKDEFVVHFLDERGLSFDAISEVIVKSFETLSREKFFYGENEALEDFEYIPKILLLEIDTSMNWKFNVKVLIEQS